MAAKVTNVLREEEIYILYTKTKIIVFKYKNKIIIIPLLFCLLSSSFFLLRYKTHLKI